VAVAWGVARRPSRLVWLLGALVLAGAAAGVLARRRGARPGPATHPRNGDRPHASFDQWPTVPRAPDRPASTGVTRSGDGPA